MKLLNALIVSTCCAFILINSFPAYAQIAKTDASACKNQINEQMAKEQRTFRSVIFGLSTVEDATVGEVRYDGEGNAWYKTEEDEWRSLAEGFETTTWGDSLMESESQIPPRKGLLETRRITTSELVPHIGQGMRALQCKIDLICDAMKQSINVKDEDPVDIIANTLGCIELTTTTLKHCHLSKGDGQDISVQRDVETYCDSIGIMMLEQEASIVKLTVEYDAAYRTMLQLAGNFDLFLQEFKTPLIHSLREMVNLVGSFNRIPCFLSSCDASP